MCDKCKDTFYITTPIYYPSDKLHIGHTYCTVAADTMARYKRMRGYDVMFLTGTDEHGQKIETKAKEAGVTPQQFVDNIVTGQGGVLDLWKLMNISNDRFIRTTDPYHVAAVQKIFKKMYENGDIYKGSYKGKYCTPCESFWTESQLKDGKCPDCGREVTDAEEEAYFFRLSKYAKPVRDLLTNTDFLEPKSRVNEMVNNFIDPGLEDLCVSRTSFTWGVPVDFDPGHVVYVWVDALFNYTTALGFMNDTYHEYDKFWPADVHFVGKEIVRFHSIIWPAMLMSMGMPLPKKVYGHGWLLLDGGKMSKSAELDFLFERTKVSVDYRLLVEKSSSELIFFRFNTPAPGIWKIVVEPLTIADGIFHIWLPLTEFLTGEVFFLESNPYSTLTNPACTDSPIVTACYNGATGGVAQASGRGYTRTRRRKPDIAAPGINIRGPLPGGRFSERSGSCAAAAITAGAVALMLEWLLSVQNVPGIDSFQIKSLLILGAVRPDSMEYPNREWGYGQLNLYNTFETMRQL